jgi:hypothetical protein
MGSLSFQLHTLIKDLEPSARVLIDERADYETTQLVFIASTAPYEIII